MRRVCPTCVKVVTIVDRAGGEVGLAGLVDIFIAEGLSRDQVEQVLDAQVGSNPTIRDRLTSQMTNALMRGLGMPGRQSPEDVMKVRIGTNSGSDAGDDDGQHKPAAEAE